jgi:hypothetical protein
MIPVVTPPTDRPGRAPAGGFRNASAWLTHSDPTWRESVIGSAFVGAVLSLGGAAAAAALVLRRRRAR